MKNQYVGDINDYRKYGLLRVLTEMGTIRSTVCWMLSANDKRMDGRKLGYLQQPEQFRDFDPELYDGLLRIVRRGNRDVATIEHAGLLPGATFFREPITDHKSRRQTYFDRFCETLDESVSLVFFDPDNGLEVKSTRRGNRGSCRYLYLDEVARAYGVGRSVLIYQHYPRRERRAYTRERIEQLWRACGAPRVMSFATGDVLFLLAVQKNHIELMDDAVELLRDTWVGQFKIYSSNSGHRPKALGCDMSGLSFGGLNLSGRDLRGWNLNRAGLQGSDLSGANLNGADARHADLSGANLTAVNLHNARLYRARLEYADLSDSDLRGADLRQANLSGANLGGARLQEANLNHSDLSAANLSGASLCGADLRGADLRRADLSWGDLSEADCEGACLIGACLIGTKVIENELVGVDLSLADVDLRGELW